MRGRVGIFGPMPVPSGMSRRVDTHPPIQGPGIRDTVTKREVRILLECFFCYPIRTDQSNVTS